MRCKVISRNSRTASRDRTLGISAFDLIALRFVDRLARRRPFLIQALDLFLQLLELLVDLAQALRLIGRRLGPLVAGLGQLADLVRAEAQLLLNVGFEHQTRVDRFDIGGRRRRLRLDARGLVLRGDGPRTELMHADPDCQTEGQRGDDRFVFGVTHGFDHSIGKRGHSGGSHTRRRRAVNSDVARGLSGPHDQGARYAGALCTIGNQPGRQHAAQRHAAANEPAPKHLAAAVELAPQRALAHVELARGLVLRSPFEVAQHQRRLHLRRQAREFLVQNTPQFTP